MKTTLTDIDLQALEAGLTKGHRLAAATHAAPETIGQIIERLRGLETDHTPDGWPAVRMRDITALIAHIDGHHSEDKLDMVGRWYMVNKDGMATLCVDREDAEAEARKADREWPRNGPHRAVQLAEAQATALAKPYCHEDCMAYTAGIEKELQDAQAAARPTPTHLEAMERAWLWMENQADSQSKGGHETFDLMMLREERDALRAAIDAAPTTQPADRHALQAEGKHPAPCARFCEANAFRADRRSDTALIRQLLEALQASSAALWETKGDPETPVTDAVNAARARLEEKP